MGLLDLFNTPKEGGSLRRLPAGSFTLDRSGTVIVSTVPSSFPGETIGEIGRLVLGAFRDAQSANLLLTELTIRFGGFKIVARELRGGAIVFLSPRDRVAGK